MGNEQQSIDDMLSEQARLESLIREKFNKILTVMFTDLKGSTTMTELEGDLAARLLIKEHNDLVTSAIREQQGVLVKFIGDGTLSYFEDAQAALRAATSIQRDIDALNLAKKFKSLVLVRIGIHSGPCLLENGDLFGDTINTASRFESSANAGEILLSSDAYNALSDKGEIYCRFDRTITLKGKKNAHDAYRAFWNPEEIEQHKAAGSQPETLGAPTSWVKISMFIAAALALVLILSLWNPMMRFLKDQPETRSLQHTLSAPD
ncbi:MAG: hypothetical protein A3I78_08565 [Gammaproteobacteria bacterium RIFCSPLOWO2_02_FULL_56_15]|nr:MAG: hypothetical protein A3I78_08565 [Gammaproteobacteria bacterium RIFCSPLOWO2_02_FULL_56_15]